METSVFNKLIVKVADSRKTKQNRFSSNSHSCWMYT